MKNKVKYIIITILVIILIVLIYAYIRKLNGEELINFTKTETQQSSNSNSSETTEVSANVQTIINTLSSSGEVSSALTEKLALHATYYFDEIYFEENDYVSEGEKILKYTNGTYLTAPYNLVISSINIPEEDSKCTNQHYIEIVCVDTLTMTANIDEDDLDTVSVGQEAEITVNSIEGKKYNGYITNISETAKYSSSGSKFTATITFENDGSIKVGMSANCLIILEKAENVVTVPVEAVQTSNNTKYVTVVKEDKTTEQVTVETGISNDAYIEIKSGLSGNETVQITKKTKTSYSNKSGGTGLK